MCTKRPNAVACNCVETETMAFVASVLVGRFSRRTDDAAGVVIVENAERYGRQNAREVQEERRRYGLVERIGADQPCSKHSLQVDWTAAPAAA